MVSLIPFDDLFIWYFLHVSIMQVELRIPRITKVVVAPTQTDFVLLDETKTANIIHVENIQSTVTNSTHLYENSMNDSASVSTGQISPPRLPLASKPPLRVYNTQLLDCSAVDMKDIIFIARDTLFVLASESIMVLSRAGLRSETREAKSLNSLLQSEPDKYESKVSGIRNTSADGKTSAANTTEEFNTNPDKQNSAESDLNPSELAPSQSQSQSQSTFHEFVHIASLIIKFDVTVVRSPVMIRNLKNRMVLIGFNDGWVQILRYSPVLLARNPKERKVIQENLLSKAVCAFKAHSLEVVGKEDDPFPESTTPSIIALKSVFEANRCNTYGQYGYLSEFFTVGSDLRIAHWGIRLTTESDAEDKLPKPFSQAKLPEDEDNATIYSELLDLRESKDTEVDFLGVSAS